jgi:hypothetical protein
MLLALAGCTSLVVWMKCASDPKKVEETVGPEQVELEFRDLPTNVRQDIKERLGKAVAESVNKAIAKLDLRDDIERELFRRMNDAFTGRGDGKVSYCIYLVKPLSMPTARGLTEVTNGTGFVLRYTRTNALLEKPVAFLVRIEVTNAGSLIEERLLIYDAPSGWKECGSSAKRYGGKKSGEEEE